MESTELDRIMKQIAAREAEKAARDQTHASVVGGWPGMPPFGPAGDFPGDFWPAEPKKGPQQAPWMPATPPAFPRGKPAVPDFDAYESGRDLERAMREIAALEAAKREAQAKARAAAMAAERAFAKALRDAGDLPALCALFWDCLDAGADGFARLERLDERAMALGRRDALRAELGSAPHHALVAAGDADSLSRLFDLGFPLTAEGRLILHFALTRGAPAPVLRVLAENGAGVSPKAATLVAKLRAAKLPKELFEAALAAGESRDLAMVVEQALAKAPAAPEAAAEPPPDAVAEAGAKRRSGPARI